MAYELPLLVLRIVQTVFGLIVAACAGYGVGQMWSEFDNTYNAFNGLIWAGVYSFLWAGGFFLIVCRFVPSANNRYLILLFEVLGNLSCLGGFAASAYCLGNNDIFVIDSSWAPWHVIQGACGMCALTWVAWCATLVVSVLNNFTHRSNKAAVQKEHSLNNYPQQQQQWPQQQFHQAGYGQAC